MLRQLVRNSSRAPVTRAVHSQSRSLHSPFAVLSTNSNSTTPPSTVGAGAGASPRATPEPSRPFTVSSPNAENTAVVEGATEFDSEAGSGSHARVYVVSQPDPSLGAPFGVQLGAYPVSEPFAH